MVLAEGIAHFRRKRLFKDVGDFSQRTLVVSQFYPKQTWQVGAAMERNAVICGLSNAVAVIEAGPTGGTIATGRQCLAQGKPLWVIGESGLTPADSGSQVLIGEGGAELNGTREWIFALYNALTNLRSSGKNKTLKKVNWHAEAALEKMQLELSIDNLEEQIELFDSSVRI